MWFAYMVIMLFVFNIVSSIMGTTAFTIITAYPSAYVAERYRLNLLDKGIIILYLEGKNYDEIADISDISKSNVGTRLQRIRQRLKQQINKEV